jgi:hypothetical protein
LLKEATFSPKVNARADEVKTDKPVFERLATNKHYVHEVLSQLKTEMELAPCTFKPAINRRPGDEEISRASVETVHLRLLAEADRRREEQKRREAERLAEESKELTFKPELSSNYPVRSRENTQQPIHERLIAESERMKVEQKKREEEATLEREKGLTFAPSIPSKSRLIAKKHSSTDVTTGAVTPGYQKLTSSASFSMSKSKSNSQIPQRSSSRSSSRAMSVASNSDLASVSSLSSRDLQHGDDISVDFGDIYEKDSKLASQRDVDSAPNQNPNAPSPGTMSKSASIAMSRSPSISLTAASVLSRRPSQVLQNKQSSQRQSQANSQSASSSASPSNKMMDKSEQDADADAMHVDYDEIYQDTTAHSKASPTKSADSDEEYAGEIIALDGSQGVNESFLISSDSKPAGRYLAPTASSKASQAKTSSALDKSVSPTSSSIKALMANVKSSLRDSANRSTSSANARSPSAAKSGSSSSPRAASNRRPTPTKSVSTPYSASRSSAAASRATAVENSNADLTTLINAEAVTAAAPTTPVPATPATNKSTLAAGTPRSAASNNIIRRNTTTTTAPPGAAKPLVAASPRTTGTAAKTPAKSSISADELFKKAAVNSASKTKTTATSPRSQGLALKKSPAPLPPEQDPKAKVIPRRKSVTSSTEATLTLDPVGAVNEEFTVHGILPGVEIVPVETTIDHFTPDGQAISPRANNGSSSITSQLFPAVTADATTADATAAGVDESLLLDGDGDGEGASASEEIVTRERRPSTPAKIVILESQGDISQQTVDSITRMLQSFNMNNQALASPTSGDGAIGDEEDDGSPTQSDDGGDQNQAPGDSLWDKLSSPPPAPVSTSSSNTDGSSSPRSSSKLVIPSVFLSKGTNSPSSVSPSSANSSPTKATPPPIPDTSIGNANKILASTSANNNVAKPAITQRNTNRGPSPSTSAKGANFPLGPPTEGPPAGKVLRGGSRRKSQLEEAVNSSPVVNIEPLPDL